MILSCYLKSEYRNKQSAKSYTGMHWRIHLNWFSCSWISYRRANRWEIHLGRILLIIKLSSFHRHLVFLIFNYSIRIKIMKGYSIEYRIDKFVMSYIIIANKIKVRPEKWNLIVKGKFKLIIMMYFNW